MKKSTLFFKVMVLMALLVPWAAWGQDRHIDPIGTAIVELNANGEIRGDNSGSNKNLKLSEDFTPSASAWNFSPESWWHDSVRPNEKTSGVKVERENNNLIKISGKPKVEGIYVRVWKWKDKKHSIFDEEYVVWNWVYIKFKKGQTDITNDNNFIVNWSAQGEGSGEYKGAEYSTAELKKELSVEYNDQDFSDYTLTVKDNKTIKDAGEYTLVITPNKDSGLVGSKEISYKVTAKKITITINDQTITLPNDKGIKTEAQGNVTAAEGAIYTGDQVSYAGSIKAADNANVNVPGEYTNGLVEDTKITSQNKNYEVSEVKPGTLTVKYELTDENWDDVLDVTFGTEGDGVYTYDGKTHEASITGELADKFEIVYKDAQGNKVEGKPLHAGDYNIYIVAKGDGDDNIAIPEGGINTNKEITIKAAEITLTGSVTVKQGVPLKAEYAVSDLDKQNVFGADDASSKLIEEFGLTFEGSVIPLVDLDLNKVGITNHAFYIKNATEGTWLINIQKSTSENYQLGDITIKDIEIKLIVTEKKVDWTDESNQQKEVTVYVNKEGQLKYGEDGEYSNSVDITLNGISLCFMAIRDFITSFLIIFLFCDTNIQIISL